MLPFMNLANQNFIGFYRMGVYTDPQLLDWWQTGYAKTCKCKLDKGKGCVRLKPMDDIPFKMIGQLVKKVSVKAWVKLNEVSYSTKRVCAGDAAPRNSGSTKKRDRIIDRVFDVSNWLPTSEPNIGGGHWPAKGPMSAPHDYFFFST